MPGARPDNGTMREAVLRVTDDAFEAMGLAELVALLREAGLVAVAELACHGPGDLVVLSLETPVPEARLLEAAGVAWVERLAGEDPATYLLKLEADADLAQPTDVVTEAVAVDGDGATFSVVGPREDVVRYVREFAASMPGVTLSRFTEYAGPRVALDALTARQREVLEVAYAAGYFDVPRAASVADVAEQLDLDPSTVGEHLQRAERNLVSRLLAG